MRPKIHKDSLLISLGITPVPEHLSKPIVEQEIIKAKRRKAGDFNIDDFVHPFQSKTCPSCGNLFHRKKQRSNPQWAEAKFCSAVCAATRRSPKITDCDDDPQEDGRRVKLTHVQRDKLTKDIQSLVDAGMTNPIIIHQHLAQADKLPIKDGMYMSESAIKRHVVLARRRIGNPMPATKVDKMIAMGRENVPTDQIMKKLNCSRNYIYLALARKKLTITKLRNGGA